MKKPENFRAAASFLRQTVDDFRLPGVKFHCDVRRVTGQLCRTLVLPFIVSLAIFSPAMAEIRQDSWVGMDKANHFGVSAPLGMFGASMAGKSADSADQFLYGTLIGALPGIAKEIYDIGRPGSTASLKDMAWNLLGAATGSMSSRWFAVTPMTYRDRVDGLRVQIRFDF
jgi:putative lipoprotein